MRHAKKGRKLKRTASHRKALLRNLATSLFEHKKLSTTVSKAKELRPYAEQLITRAKHALVNEKLGKLPENQTVDIHNRRMVGRHIANKAVLQELFDTIAPMVEERQGGYCRIIKTGFRRGDAAQTAIIELVDWSAPQDGAVSKKSKKKATATKAKKTRKSKKSEEVIAEDTLAENVTTNTLVEEVAADIPDTTEEPATEATEETSAEETTETPAEEVVAEVTEEVTEAPAEEVSDEAAEVKEINEKSEEAENKA